MQSLLPALTSETSFVFNPCLQILWQKGFIILICKDGQLKGFFKN